MIERRLPIENNNAAASMVVAFFVRGLAALLTLRVVKRGLCALLTLRVMTDGTYLPRFLGSSQLSVGIDAFA